MEGLTVGGAVPGRAREGCQLYKLYRGYGGALEASPSGSGAVPQKPALFALENPPKLRNNCNESIITDPAFIFSMRRTTVHSFRKYDNDGKIHYTDTLFMHLENTW